jgi:hypothetical protein
MPEDTGSGAAATATDERTDATSAGSEGSGNGAAATATDTEELREAGKKALESERQARKEAESKLTGLEKRIKEFEDRDKSEGEKTQERLAELERERDDARRELEETKLSIEVQAEAAKAGAKYPDAIVRFVNPADVDRDKDGKAKNLEALIGSVRERYPDLFRARAGRGDASGGNREGDTGGNSDEGSDMSARIRRAAGKG